MFSLFRFLINEWRRKHTLNKLKNGIEWTGFDYLVFNYDIGVLLCSHR